MRFCFEDALNIAAQAHKGQLDRSGDPYIFHPLRVAMKFPIYMWKEQQVGILHDVIEDTSVTLADLEAAGACKEVLDAVAAISRTEDVRYLPYLEWVKQRVKPVELARKVKIEDIKDNTSLERMIRLTPADQERLHNKYEPALRELVTF